MATNKLYIESFINNKIRPMHDDEYSSPLHIFQTKNADEYHQHNQNILHCVSNDITHRGGHSSKIK